MRDHKKGVFFDGHERDDVVSYRGDFLDRMEELDARFHHFCHRQPFLMERSLWYELYMTNQRFTPTLIRQNDGQMVTFLAYVRRHWDQASC